jgi:hypothetical protein
MADTNTVVERESSNLPVGVAITIIITKQEILANHIITSNFQRLINGRQQIFALIWYQVDQIAQVFDYLLRWQPSH